ncbi:DNA methyltransferase, partial [Salmonella enterica]|uniref:DNA methyltransferase n=1 Tax=Salmonella enterica TaxID=28901 RepID=UPI000CA6AA82
LYKSTPNEIIQYVISKEYSLEKLDFDTKESHIKVNDLYKNKVINGDVLKVLENMENNSIHLTFTSPPYYNARDYSIYQSYDEYLNFLERTFKEIHRITKDGRYLVINTSPMIIPR